MLGDDTKVEACGVGTIILTPQFTLTHVFYIPDLHINLCSVSPLTQLGYRVIFNTYSCLLEKDGRTLASAQRYGDLYAVSLQDKAFAAVTVAESQAVYRLATKEAKALPLELWHHGMGHLNKASVKKLQDISHGVNIVITDPVTDTPSVCSACLDGKQHRTFNRKTPASRTNELFALVHSDSCGPF